MNKDKRTEQQMQMDLNSALCVFKTNPSASNYSELTKQMLHYQDVIKSVKRNPTTIIQLRTLSDGSEVHAVLLGNLTFHMETYEAADKLSLNLDALIESDDILEIEIS